MNFSAFASLYKTTHGSMTADTIAILCMLIFMSVTFDPYRAVHSFLSDHVILFTRWLMCVILCFNMK